ncbi:MAG TPA: DHA2 family efflux MFS transporter permease subunit [Solirubrobacteraceae bacterium]|nr:DHA2 family efflux MFS transporter permease subunit [Solirubrobacteraceae bacterium]
MNGSTSTATTESSRRWVALAVLCLSLLIVTLDATVLNVALPTLVRKLHASSSDLQWIVDAYVLVFACLMLVAGSLGDRIGRKRTFLAGLVAFAACSTWAAFSGSVGMLIAARASMGIGAALIMPSTLAIITNTFTDRHERQRAIGFWAATSGAGIALGPIVAGLLLARFAWGSVFLINVPIAAAGFALALALVADSKNPAAQRPDVVGSLLSIAGLGLLLYGIIEAPVHGWTSALVLTTGLGGLAILGAFVAWEWRSEHPMLNLRFFTERSFSGAIISVALTMFGLLGALFLLTQFLQFDLGYTPLQAGVRMLPAAGAIAVVAPLSSQLVRRLGTRVTITIGLVLVAAGLWQISGATVATTYSGIVVGMALLGLGAGLVIPSTAGSVMGSLPEEHTGVGAGTNGTFLQAGGALGVAVIGSLLATRYQNDMITALAAHPIPHPIEQTILGSVGGALGVAGHLGGVAGAFIAHAARGAFISGMRLGLRTAAIVAIAGAALALAILPGRKLHRRTHDRPATTRRTARPHPVRPSGHSR